MNLSEFFTGLSLSVIADEGTLALSGDDIPSVVVGGQLRTPTPWSWPGTHWVSGRSCRLLYLARGPGMTLKIGISGKPLTRVHDLSRTRSRALVAERLGAVAGSHRLLLVISKGSGRRERALLSLVAHERVSGEWSRGPDSELLLATLASRALPFFSLSRKAA